jgi:hypothetical protein
MNKKLTLILLAACLFGIFSVSAQKPVRSFFTINSSIASAGQTRFESHYNVGSFVGGGYNLSLGYQLYAYHFIFSIEAEAGATVLTNYSKEAIKNGNNVIPQGMLELLGNGHVNIPTMIGGEFGKFYFKLGVVPSFNLLNGATVIGPVLNKENPEPYENTNLMLYKNPFQLFGRIELGGSFGKPTPYEDPIQPKARFYLGGYIDFGFTKDLPTEPRGSYSSRMPYAVSIQNMSDKVHQVSVGLKFSCLLNFAK